MLKCFFRPQSYPLRLKHQGGNKEILDSRRGHITSILCNRKSNRISTICKRRDSIPRVKAIHCAWQLQLNAACSSKQNDPTGSWGMSWLVGYNRAILHFFQVMFAADPNLRLGRFYFPLLFPFFLSFFLSFMSKCLQPPHLYSVCQEGVPTQPSIVLSFLFNCDALL